MDVDGTSWGMSSSRSDVARASTSEPVDMAFGSDLALSGRPTAVRAPALFGGRKLQIFVSSTYLDLRDERQAVVEAILRAGHIPAGMELFAAEDRSQWQVIQRWIDESDAFILILGGRYGSLEPESGKSYIHLEYEHALKAGKHPVALIAAESLISSKVRTGPEPYATYIEQSKPSELRDFREVLRTKLSPEFSSTEELKLKVLEAVRLAETRQDVVGWIRGNAPASSLAFSAASHSLPAGIGRLNDLEGNHGYWHIANYLRMHPAQELLLASPYHRYWVESTGKTRLERLLEAIPELRVSVVVFAPADRSAADGDEPMRQLSRIQARSEDRVQVIETSRPSDVSYITYLFKPQDSDELQRRLVLGLQMAEYHQRPFIELVSAASAPDDLTAAVLAFHRELGDRAAA